MGISLYPRAGHPLAPATLADMLAAAVPPELLPEGARALQFADLDARSWARFGAKACHRLAAAVVAQVRLRLPAAPEEVRRRRLPRPPFGTTWDDLELTVRTSNCLGRSEWFAAPCDIGNKTIGDVVGLYGFGANSLVDLLTSVESLSAGGGIRPELTPTSTEENGIARASQSIAELARVLHSQTPVLADLIRQVREVAGLVGALPGADHIADDDPRIGPALRAADPHARDVKMLVDRTLATLAAVPSQSALLTGLREIKQLLDRLTDIRQELRLLHQQLSGIGSSIDALLAIPLEDELRDVFLAAAPRPVAERNLKVFGRRTGLDGGMGCTLEEAAREFGITRERVRQICTALTKPLAGKRPFAPQLDRALSTVVRRLPGGAEEIERAIVEEGIARARLRLPGLRNIAKLMGRSTKFGVVEVRGRWYAVSMGDARLPRVIVLTARRLVARFGMATLEDVADSAGDTHGRPIGAGLVQSILGDCADFRWLDADRGAWFWMTGVPRNRMLNQMRKVVSVCRRVHIAELRAGLARYHRLRGFSPPRRVLLEFCRQNDCFAVDGEMVTRRGVPDWQEVLRGSERKLVELLRGHGPALGRAQLEELALSSGVSPPAFSMLLSSSPVISRLALGVYALVGARVPPGLVDPLLRHGRRSRVLHDYGWLDGGQAWLAYRVSRSMVSSGGFYVPAGMARLLQGEYDLRGVDGSRLGRLTLGPTNSWGLGPFFRRRGGEAGDMLLLVLDPEHRHARVELGDESLLAAAPAVALPTQTTPRNL